MAMVEEEEQGGVPEWVVTFGDMMSLLLTFFVMLVSMSEIKEEQRQALVESLRRQFGHETATTTLMTGPVSPMSSLLARLATLGRAQRANTMDGGDEVQAPEGDNPRVTAIRRGEETAVGGVLYFPEESSELTEEHKKILQATARVISGKPQKIEIRGHSSARPLPPNSPYRNHWDLAYSRCFKTMEFLTTLGIDPKRLRIGVAAENEPAHIDYDEVLQKKNSRVEVLMLDQLTEDLAGTKEEKRQKLSDKNLPPNDKKKP